MDLSNLPEAGLVAHRGLAASFPENTIRALDASIQAGVSIIEFDLQITADGEPVLFHDATFERVGGVEADIRDLTLSQARKLSVGCPSQFGGQFADQGIDTLDETVAHLTSLPTIHSWVEIKGESIERFGLEQCASPILRAIEPLRGLASVISFEPDAVRLAKTEGWPVGLCLDDYSELWRALAEDIQPDFLLLDETYLSSSTDLWPGGWRYGCWEVVDIDRAKALHEMGVHYVESMAVDVLIADTQISGWA